MNDLIPRTTLTELLGWRARALALAEEARGQYVLTLAKIAEASKAASQAASEYALHGLDKHVTGRHDKPEEFTRRVREDMDRSMWSHLLTICGVRGLMDQQACKEFEQQLASEPPEITAENVRATFAQFQEDSYTIFRRGLVNAFVKLDRTYRSHDGFKIGNRLVRSYAMTDYGSIYGASEEVLCDVDRVMHILDGRKVGPGWYSPLAGHLQRSIRHNYSSGILPDSLSTEYWHVKWFKNRNMHLYPLRKDLVRRANRLIAEHFDEALGAGPDAAGAQRYHRAKPHHSEVEDFYPTPAPIVARMMQAAQVRPEHVVLEPSAGEGAIATALLAVGVTPDCVEIDTGRANILRDLLPPGAAINMDFLKMHPEPEYDRILMNPPFGKGAAVQHVFHALRFLKPGGRLVAILGGGLSYRSDGPTSELRERIKAWKGTIAVLPAGSFQPAGTNVETVMLVLDKPGAALPAPAELPSLPFDPIAA